MSYHTASSPGRVQHEPRPRRASHDLLLSAVFIASGPALWTFGTVMLQAPPAHLLRSGQIGAEPGIEVAETLLGLAAAAAGLLISAGALLALAALLAQGLAARVGAWRTEQTLARLSPEFLRRSAILTLGAGLALTAAAADSWNGPSAPGAAARTHAVAATAADAQVPDEHDADPDPASCPAPGAGSAPGAGVGSGSGAEAEEPMSGLFTPEAPVPNTDRHQGLPQRPSGAADPEEVVVRPGDSLWDIAADHLGADATDWEIAESWPRWYAANRALIGADPAIIHPGTVLRAPTG